MNQCGVVEPFWVALGWVQWQGAAGRERLHMIEYRRCASWGLRTTIGGIERVRCPMHWEHKS